MMRALRRITRGLFALAVGIMLAFGLFAMARGRPQDLPWTPLDLGDPVGRMTGRKIAALTQNFPLCRALLDRAGVAYRSLAPVPVSVAESVAGTVAAGQCGYRDGVRFAPGGTRSIALVPRDVGMACPVAAALSVWEWDVVQPAARRYFGQPVAAIDHLGSYNCRRIYGSRSGSISEHATADAIDVAGFVLADGTRITVRNDWADKGDAGTFLRTVRNGACGLFSTALSPDYNAAHRDHLHLDQAERGATGWRTCR